jgi:DNA-binding XRE family transcriptional regulator
MGLDSLARQRAGTRSKLKQHTRDGGTIMTTLAQARRRKALTMRDLAQKAQLHQNTVGKIEKGKVRPTMRTIRAIARALEVEPSAIAWPGDPLALEEA